MYINPQNFDILYRYQQWRFFARITHYLIYELNANDGRVLYQQMETQKLHRANLFTSDLYQFTCSYTYFVSNKHEQSATFEVFFRKYPFGGKYAVLGGIRAVKQFLDTLQITNEQEQYLTSIFPHMKHEYFQWLRDNLKKPIKIKSFKQGQIVFAKQPLITYTGPIGIVQLLETPILNLIGFASLVATNASRMVKAVQPKQCLQFGIRRAQGPDGAATASQFAYLGGFIGTSNVQLAQKLKIPCYGTMSHAFVTSFSSMEQIQDFELNGINIVKRVKQIKEEMKVDTHSGELASFIMFAKAFPNNFTTLIDTFSTIDSGMINTVIVGKALVEAGFTKIGIRLDSGDLGAQSIKCRQIWNKNFPNGPKLKIIASDDLHEERLIQMQLKGNQIDIFAIGTHIATCKKQPALGLVCKLVQLDGKPKMKLSEDQQKATYPANKSVYRVWTNQQQQSSFDIISLDEEELKGNIKIVDPSKKYEQSEVKIQKIVLLNQDWEKSAPYSTLQKCRQHFNTAKVIVKKVLQIKDPKSQQVMMTEKYHAVLNETLEKNRVAKQQIQG